jgi:GT2 family glycosyltransferase
MEVKMRNIYFITVNFNNSDVTIDFVRSVADLVPTEDNTYIVIVDNNSSEEDFHKLREGLEGVKKIKIIRNERNLGYFPGLNVGIHSIVDRRDEDLVVIGNNDLLFKENFLVELTKNNHRDAYVLAPNITTLDGYHQNPQLVVRYPKIKKFMLKMYFSSYNLAKILRFLTMLIYKIKKRKDNVNWDKEMFIQQGVGACYVLTSKFFKFYKELDNRVFLYGEESLLTNQVFAAGGKILYKPNLIVYHQTNLEETLYRNCNSKERYKNAQESFKIYSKYL